MYATPIQVIYALNDQKVYRQLRLCPFAFKIQYRVVKNTGQNVSRNAADILNTILLANPDCKKTQFVLFTAQAVTK